MQLDPELCYRAATARDRRFDGRFFIGVVTTGVYCRPVCPVRPPKRKNQRYYPTAAAAESEGFRPCRRCRPETAPGTPAWRGSSATVSRALRLIQESPGEDARVAQLASRLGVGERQLRRLFVRHLGASPNAIARTQRAHFARRLIDETVLPMTTVAHSAGYRSVRQFNHSIRATFGRTPSELRKGARGQRSLDASQPISLRLPYRPPFDWQALLGFLAPRVLRGVEHVDAASYRRVVSLDGSVGSLEVSDDSAAHALVLRLRLDRPGDIAHTAERVRRQFDLDADPLQITTDLAHDPDLAPLIAARPGVRIPGAFEPFEVAVRAVLGQQVSVKGASTLAARLIRAFGKPVVVPSDPDLTHLFPTPDRLAEADVASLGMPQTRARAIRGLAAAVAAGAVALDGSRDVGETLEALLALPGIGDWTAQYVALRVLGEPDCLPASDLGLRSALGHERIPERELREQAEAWRPWRSYAALWLWSSLSD